MLAPESGNNSQRAKPPVFVTKHYVPLFVAEGLNDAIQGPDSPYHGAGVGVNVVAVGGPDKTYEYTPPGSVNPQVLPVEQDHAVVEVTGPLYGSDVVRWGETAIRAAQARQSASE